MSADAGLVLVADDSATVRAIVRLETAAGDPATAAVPVVFLTGRGGTAEIGRALRAGAHDHVSKPPEPTELLARLVLADRRLYAAKDSGRDQVRLTG